MIKKIDESLYDLGELIHKLGSGFPPDSLSHKIMIEGAEGAAIRGSLGAGVPIPFHKIVRRLIRLHKAVSELPSHDNKMIERHYKIYIDPFMDKMKRWQLYPYTERTYYKRMHRIHKKIQEELKNISIEA